MIQDIITLDKYKIFESLEGYWSFAREIDNKAFNSLSGSVAGQASFVPVKNEANVLHYIENGEFTAICGQKNTVTQEYFYKITNDNIEVCFGCGGEMLELFHLINDNAEAKHICRNDCYKVRYEFGFDQFSIIYDVIGTNKHYISRTVFKRDMTKILVQYE